MVLTSRQFSKLVVNPAFRRSFPEFGLQFQSFDQEQDLRRRERRCSRCGAGKTQFQQAVLLIRARPDLATKLRTYLGVDELKVIDRSRGKAEVKTLP